MYHLIRKTLYAIPVILMALVFAVTLFPSSAAHAASTTYTVDIASTTPTYDRPSGPFGGQVDCTTISSTTNRRYQAQDFYVDTAGSYTLDVSAININGGTQDTVFILYAGGFDPSNTFGNCVWYNDDDGSSSDNDGTSLASFLTVNLTPGVQYTLVSSVFSSNLSNTVNFDVTIDGPGNITLGALSSGTGSTTTPTSTVTVERPPDDRINWHAGDDNMVMYIRNDSDGHPAMHIYRVNAEGHGWLAMVITQDDIAHYVGNRPQENTLIRTENGVELYILTTGEFQVNVTPDWEGKVQVIIFDGIPASNVYQYEFNIYGE